MMESRLLDSGSSVMKSMLIVSQGESGIGSRCSSPVGSCFRALVQRHKSHVEMYLPVYLLRRSLACTRARCWAKSSYNKLYKTILKFLESKYKRANTSVIELERLCKSEVKLGNYLQNEGSYIPKSTANNSYG